MMVLTAINKNCKDGRRSAARARHGIQKGCKLGLRAILLCALLGAAGSSLAQPSNSQQNGAVLSTLTWADHNDLERKVRLVDQLGRRHFGIPIRNDKTDLQLLQRIADGKVIAPEKTAELQALGAVMGELLKDELDLRWVVYEDDLGRNRALCYANTTHCLFPLTMLSRRLEVGVKVNVEEIYQEAVASIRPYLPDDNGFDGKQEPPKPSWEAPSGPIKKIRVL